MIERDDRSCSFSMHFRCSMQAQLFNNTVFAGKMCIWTQFRWCYPQTNFSTYLQNGRETDNLLKGSYALPLYTCWTHIISRDFLFNYYLSAGPEHSKEIQMYLKAAQLWSACFKAMIIFLNLRQHGHEFLTEDIIKSVSFNCLLDIFGWRFKYNENGEMMNMMLCW